MAGARPRVMYVLVSYPSLSETYIHTELAAVSRDHDVLVVASYSSDVWDREPYPFVVEPDPDAVCELVEDFRPDVLHSHWLHPVPVTAHVSQRTGVPYTVRTHGFDVQWAASRERLFQFPGPTAKFAPRRVRMAAKLLRDDACLGAICFPWARRRLEKLGVPTGKLHDCFPVVDVARFLDRSANEDGVMYGGPVLESKQIGNYLTLAKMTPGQMFDLYAIHDRGGTLARRNEALDRPVTIHENVDHENMPAEYKKHSWYVRVPDLDNRGIGWPVSIAEAQASGVGVCMTRFRPDLADYVGKGGFLVESLAEASEVISKPFPEEMRELGFAQAKKSDIREHLSVLTDLWEPALNAGVRCRHLPRDSSTGESA